MTDSEKLKICVEAIQKAVHITWIDECVDAYDVLDEALLKISQPKEQGEEKKAREFWICYDPDQYDAIVSIEKRDDLIHVREVIE